MSAAFGCRQAGLQRSQRITRRRCGRRRGDCCGRGNCSGCGRRLGRRRPRERNDRPASIRDRRRGLGHVAREAGQEKACHQDRDGRLPPRTRLRSRGLVEDGPQACRCSATTSCPVSRQSARSSASMRVSKDYERRTAPLRSNGEGDRSAARLSGGGAHGGEMSALGGKLT